MHEYRTLPRGGGPQKVSEEVDRGLVREVAEFISVPDYYKL